MTAKYPASIATTADLGQPNASDMLDSPDHASLHRQITDEIIAIETALGVGLANAGGVTGFANLAAFPATGVVNKVYLALDTGKMYRWDAGTTAYVAIGGGGTVAGALHYDGAKDVTAALGTYAPTQGATVTASAAGAVNASWPGAAGQTVSIGDVLMFDGTNWHVQAGMADVNLMVRKTDVLAGAGLHDLTAALTGITPVANMVVKASKAGTPHASWAGITGTVKAGAVYQYNGTAWVVVDQTKVPTAGAANLMYVNVAGDTMYGPLVIDPPQGALNVALKLGETEFRDSGARVEGGASVFIGKGVESDTGSPTSFSKYSVIIGEDAGKKSTGPNNVFIGRYSGQKNTTGSANTCIGLNTMMSNTSGANNVAVGATAMQGNIGGLNNIGIGYGALLSNINSNDNTAFGTNSLNKNVSGAGNCGFGKYSLYETVSGNYNVAAGIDSMRSNKTGSDNVALGQEALYSNTSGSYNIAIGRKAGIGQVSANLLTAGTYSGPFVIGDAYFYSGSGAATVSGETGVTSIANGSYFYPTKSTGITITAPTGAILSKAVQTGKANYNVSIGAGSCAYGTNSTAIGANAVGDKANQVVLGDNTVTEVKTHGLYVGTVGGVSQRMIGLQELKTIVAASADFNALKAAIAALT